MKNRYEIARQNKRRPNGYINCYDEMPTRAEMKEACEDLLKALQKFEHPPATVVTRNGVLVIYDSIPYSSGCGSPAGMMSDEY